MITATKTKRKAPRLLAKKNNDAHMINAMM